MLLADRILDDPIAAARASGSTLAREAAAVLAAWDRTTDTDSRGGVLFALWGMSMFPMDVLTPDAFASPGTRVTRSPRPMAWPTPRRPWRSSR